MSFIVKGAEAPKTCMDCPLADIEQGWCTSEMVTIIDFDERPVECPLVALPDKHGRLIDADADSLKDKLKFINEAEHQIYGRESWGFTAKCIYAIDDADVVIEAEDGE